MTVFNTLFLNSFATLQPHPLSIAYRIVLIQSSFLHVNLLLGWFYILLGNKNGYHA